MTGPPITYLLSTPVVAGKSAVYTGQLVDQVGNPLPAANLTSLTLSLYDRSGGGVVNGVQDVNILNTGRGVVDAQGNLTVTLLPADTAMVGAAPLPGGLQYRRLLLNWAYTGGMSGGHEVDFAVQQLGGT